MKAVYIYMKGYIFAFLWAMFILFATIANVSTLHKLHLSDLFAFDKPIHMTLFGVQALLLIKARFKFAQENYRNLVFMYCECIIWSTYGNNAKPFDHYPYV